MQRRIRKYLFLLPYGLLFLTIVIISIGISRWWEHSVGVLERGEASEERLPLSMFDGERFLPDSTWQNPNYARYRNDLDPALFLNPPSMYGPWLRWWWPGAWVDSLQLKAELEDFSQKGFGGVDIQALSIGLDPDMLYWDRVYNYNSQSFHQHVKELFPKARSLGMDIDVSISNLSPSGGPHVGLEEGVQSLAFAEATVLGNKIISMKLPVPEVPYFYQWMGWEEMFIDKENDQWASFRLDKLELLEVFASKTLREDRSAYSIYLDDYIQLDPDSINIITDYVQDGQLIWDAPSGYWKVIVVYKMPAAQSAWSYPGKQKGYVLNPFNSSKVLANHNYFLGQRTGFPAFYGIGLRGFSQAPFSYLAERMYTDELLEFFKKRNKYSLSEYLPILSHPGHDNHLMNLQSPKRGPAYKLTDLDHKIREDYAETLSDFFIQNYLDSTLSWSNKRGLVSRITPYGLNLDILKAVGHISLPEASQRYSGYGADFVKMLSSGAELYQRPWVSSLCLDGQEMVFSNSPADIKASIDDLFLNGVNHVVLQGAPYQKIDAVYGKESWMPFSSPFYQLEDFSEQLGESNPFWKYQDQVNAYVKKCQYMLRQGKSNTPILIYYPFLGFPGRKGSEFPELESIGLDESLPAQDAVWLEKTRILLEGLNELGLGWIWVNDESLQKAKNSNGQIQIANNRYDRLILNDVPIIKIETLKNIVKLSKSGSNVLVLEAPPKEVKGFYKFAEKMSELQHLATQLPKPIRLDNKDDIQNYFSGFPVKQKLSFARPYEFLRATRRTGRGFDLIFLKNLAAKDRFFELKIDQDREFNYLFNPWKGSIHLLEGAKEGAHRIFLNSQSSAFILSTKEAWVPDSLLSQWDRLDQPLLGELSFNARHLNRWDFTMSNEKGTEAFVSFKDTTLFKWSLNEDLKYCSEEALYSTFFEIGDTLNNKQYLLDLGQLRGVAEVSVNTEFVGASLIPPYRMDISKYISPGLNTIEIWLISPLKNRLLGRAVEGDDTYERFEKKPDQLKENGLKGPVIIWEVEKNSELNY